MFSASQLSEDQKTTLRQWAAEGASIADLQKRMKDDMDLGVTYMDARFMVLDLGIEIIEEKEEEPEAPAAEASPEGAASEPIDGAAEIAGGPVSVSKDAIAVPGSVVSGKVTFSDGETAVWMIDEYGRPGLDTATEGYRPSPEDIEVFQKELTALVRDSGI